MFDGRRSSLEISVFYTEFFIRIPSNRILKLKKTKYYELPGNHAQTSIQEFLFLCHVLWKRPRYCKSRKLFPSKVVAWIFLMKAFYSTNFNIIIIIIIINNNNNNTKENLIKAVFRSTERIIYKRYLKVQNTCFDQNLNAGNLMNNWYFKNIYQR